MCTDEYLRVSSARAAVDHVAETYLRLPLVKALDLSTPGGFDQAVAQIAARLRTATAASESDAFRQAIADLDVDWSRTTREARARLVRTARERAGEALRRAVPRIEATLGRAASEVVAAARNGARRRHRLVIGADFNAVDRRLVAYLRTSETAFVTDSLGRRADSFSSTARRVVADALEQGLARADIAAALESAARDVLSSRGSFYWETVAGAFVGRGRSFSQLSSFAEAGIDRYRLEAVLDEHTTATCRFLHGRAFFVRTGLDQFVAAERAPGLLKDIAPWVRERVSPETGRRELYVKQRGERIPLADELRSAVGTRDDVGEFELRGDLELAGVLVPPFHGLCRTVLVAVA